MRRDVLTLWQTRILRSVRLTVRDEIENGLAYYEYTFLRELPRLYADIEDQLAAAWPGRAPRVLPRAADGSWIGGDRDGNPYVTDEVTRHAMKRHADGRVRTTTSKRSTPSAAELSMSRRLVSVTPRARGAGARLAVHVRSSRDEPYRNALTGIYARLAATSRDLVELAA